jgi:hypothetical protein
MDLSLPCLMGFGYQIMTTVSVTHTCNLGRHQVAATIGHAHYKSMDLDLDLDFRYLGSRRFDLQTNMINSEACFIGRRNPWASTFLYLRVKHERTLFFSQSESDFIDPI